VDTCKDNFEQVLNLVLQLHVVRVGHEHGRKSWSSINYVQGTFPRPLR
jgi:hypothetical protein